RPISSRAIRRAVADGELAIAANGLGRPYAFRGLVVPGSRRGRELGFPTVNLSLASPLKLLPPEGVYAVRVCASRGEFGGMLNLGGRPTFDESALSPEVHVFGASGEWYGESVRVEFISRLRDTVRFQSVADLTAQLARDADAARAALAF
ncbi:MAG TPA: riboflavin kinase, partial [Gemmatimonadaceae bacterium]|nr:riboflavin kinase [Gemmatimonadaceae bacterium]